MKQTCWNFFDCKKTDCPQHGWLGVHCWENTFNHCGRNMVDGQTFQKMTDEDRRSVCESCLFYMRYHFSGWGLSDGPVAEFSR